MTNDSLLATAVIYELLCQAEDTDLSKIAVIKKTKGYWGVFSEKGRLLGKYKTKAEAVKRLRQIEYFKHHKKASVDEDVTYSALIRELSKKYPEDILKRFRKIYKQEFDQALINQDKNPEEKALNSALQFIDELDEDLSKVASAIEMGNATYAGKYIAEIVKFLMRRISPERRERSIKGLKKKIYLLNEYDISGKKMPASSALGQAISLTKNLLMMHSPLYVRNVLNSIVSHL